MQENKKFYGGFFISREQLQEAGIPYPIELKYYKVENKIYNTIGESSTNYGIQVIKKEYDNGKTKIETNLKENLTTNEEYANYLLNILHKNQVTPIGLDDVIEELIKN